MIGIKQPPKDSYIHWFDALKMYHDEHFKVEYVNSLQYGLIKIRTKK